MNQSLLLRSYYKTLIGVAALLAWCVPAQSQVSITCPADIIQGNDVNQCSAVVNFTAPIGTGSGTGITTTLTQGLAPGSIFPVGITEIIYTVTNNEGASNSCTFYVEVQDTQIPTYTCPPDIMVDTDPGLCTAVVFFSIPPAIDNCTLLSNVQTAGLPSGSAFPVGENNLTFRATDVAGNLAFCRVKVIVTDVGDPMITCPADITQNVVSGCTAIVNYTAPIGTDACSPTMTNLTAGLAPGSAFPVGVTIVTYQVTDLAGNTASCSFNVTVVDAIAPQLTCSANLNIATTPGNCTAIVNLPIPVATDNCPGVVVAQTAGLPSGSAFPTGQSEVTFTATDASGNTAMCSYFVNVTENEPPAIVCPANIAVGNDLGQCGAIVNYTPPVGADNCPGASTTLFTGLGSGSLFPIGTTTEGYIVTDASGNAATCSFTVTVTDTENPSFTCPSDIVVDNAIGDCAAVINFPLPGANDNCPGLVVTQTGGPVSGSAFSVGTSILTFTATDASGNTATCNFNITVNDTEAPEIVCPADFAFTIPNSDCSAAVTYPDPTISDNCPGVTFGLIAGPANGAILTTGIYEVTLQAIDASGNTSTCAFEISVTETSLPTITCPADLMVSTDVGACNAVVNFPLPAATDACTPVTVSQTGGPTSGSTFPIGSTLVSFTATDSVGNTASCSYSIIVEDQELPIISCPADIAVENDPGGCGAIVNFALPMATDNCPGVIVSQTSGPVSGSFFPVGSTALSFSAADAAGNGATCSISVIVSDTEAPTIACPANFTIAIPGGNCSGMVTYPLPIIADNCPNPSLNLVSGPASGSMVSAGVYTVLFEAIDASGNSTQCDFEITVTETSIPVIACPADITVPTQPGECTAIVNFPSATATDSCSAVSIIQIGGPASGSTFPIGPSQIEFTAEDPFGNMASCSFTIVVVDQENPVIDCLGNLTVTNDPGQCGAIVNFALPSATDNCPGIVVIQSTGPVSGSLFPVGTTSVSFTATDAAGNTAVCNIDIVVNDVEPPIITCPADVTVPIAGGFCSASINYPNPTFSDNCPGSSVTVISGPASGSILFAGVYTVALEAIDGAGNTATCQFTLTVTETSIPVITCPANIALSTDIDACGAMATLIIPNASDSCSTVTVSQTDGPVSGTEFPVGTSLVEFTATDPFGNAASCTYEVIVTDNQMPEIDCPAAVVIDADAGACSALIAFPLPTATDNCGIASLIQTGGPANGDISPVGTYTVVFEAQDLAGNVSTCSFELVVADSEDPIISCPADIVIPTVGGSCDAIVNFGIPTATDNCTIASITQASGPISGTSLAVGNYVVSFTATDASGNNATCSFDISVTENVAPVINCPADITATNDAGECGAVVTYSAPTATDNCSGVTVTLTAGLPSGSFFPVGATIITYTATDSIGNSSTCDFTVTVTDDEAPMVNCPANITVSADPGICETVVTFPDPTATDNCTSGITITQVLGAPSGSVFIVGTKTIEYEIVDAAGNVSLCSFEIIVEDNEAPELSCPMNVDVVTPNGECTSAVAFAIPVASDNCGIASVVQSQGLASGSAFPIGVSTIEFTAVDDSGNEATCSFTITISEDVAPTINCPADITVNNDPGVCGAVVNYALPTAIDNCGNPTLTLLSGPVSGATFPVGTTSVTYQAEDESGNTAMCSFNVTVLDIQGPDFANCPANTSINASNISCGAIFTFDAIVAEDNCDGFVAVQQVAGPVSGTNLPLGATVFSFIATDGNGLSSTCEFTITVVDVTSPTFTDCVPTLTFMATGIDCSAAISFDIPLATDNCSAVVSQISGPLSGDVLTAGAYIAVFEAIDPSGNVSICETQILVLDEEAPVFDCPDSFETCELNPTFDLPQASDNCGAVSVVQTQGPASGGAFVVGENILTFEATDASGNVATCSYSITLLQNAPRPEAGPDQNICDESATTLQGSDPAPAIGTWTQIAGATASITNPNLSDTEVTNLTTGTNIFVWSLDPGNGCETTSDTVSVIVEPGVSLEAGPDRLITLGSSVELLPVYSPPEGNFVWQPETGLSCVTCPNPNASPTENTLYFVSFTTDLGCNRIDSVLVRVFREIPNTITPDGDGVNDVWNIPGIEAFPSAQVVIYNRWGGEIFNSQGYREPWNGQHEDKDLPTGSYYYLINYNASGIENLNGTVNIIR